MISIVVPAFNEEDGILELYRRVTEASLSWGDTLELIIVDDGSADRTLSILEAIAEKDPRLKVLALSRNFGHQPAVTAGLDHARGEIVAVIDADLQDPPESLLPFIRQIRDGYDVVYAIRTKRKESIFKRFSYWLYYRILKRLATLDIPLDAGDFCVMRREVVLAMRQLPERNRFVRGIRTWVGFRQTGLAYERHSRYAGEPKYTLRKLIQLGSDGIFNFSYRPLQLISVFAFAVSAVAVCLGLVVVAQYAFNWTILGYNPREVQGWASLMLMVLLACAVQLFCLAILAAYVGRLFEETKKRPIYLIRSTCNINPLADSRGRD